jgi:hypothetical protein
MTMFTAGPVVWVVSNNVISVKNHHRELIYVLEKRFSIIFTECLCRYQTLEIQVFQGTAVSVSQMLPTLEKHCASTFKVSAEKMDILYR